MKFRPRQSIKKNYKGYAKIFKKKEVLHLLRLLLNLSIVLTVFTDPRADRRYSVRHRLGSVISASVRQEYLGPYTAVTVRLGNRAANRKIIRFTLSYTRTCYTPKFWTRGQWRKEYRVNNMV